MIKASELRIGNWVDVQIKGLVNPKGAYQADVDLLRYLFDNAEAFDQIHPIPLTEEWLVRFGFTPSKDLGDLNLGPINFYREKRAYGCTGKSSHFWLSSGGDDEYYDYPLTLEYVHQLQNLYFALTGEELTLNP